VTSRARLLKSLLLALVVLAVVTWGRKLVDAYFLYPWSNERLGPTLTGLWIGEPQTDKESLRGVLLEMHRLDRTGRSRCTNCTSIEGRAITCDQRGRELTQDIFGQPTARRARRVALNSKPVVQSGLDGLELGSMRGTWDGADAFVLEATYHRRQGSSASGSPDDPNTGGFVSLPMRRGSEAEFRTLCARSK
jgi:hypothetical protein